MKININMKNHFLIHSFRCEIDRNKTVKSKYILKKTSDVDALEKLSSVTYSMNVLVYSRIVHMSSCNDRIVSNI